jgi:UDP-3-O-[3-hydroxymyristoyl] glucosamine N-acyltransferase
VGSIRLSELSEHLAASGLSNSVEGDREVVLSAVNTLEDAGPGEISFLANPKYHDRLATTQASAVLVDRHVEIPNGLAALRSDDPYAALCMTIVKVHGYRQHPQWGISERANIAASARVGAGANIGPDVHVADDVTIGANATIYPGCYIARGCVVGDEVTLYPNVVVYEDCILGNRVTIHAGSVIGEDGLGYAPVGENWHKIPQVGRVEIEDDVEIGASCTIDRATLGCTRIGAGTKFSNLIAIGHGAKIGPNCMVVAQVGVAGSTTVGKHVTMAGQAGIVGHVHIGDNAAIGAQAGVKNDVEPGTTVLGTPAVPITEAKRQMLIVQQLPQMRQRLKELEAEVKTLRALVQGDGVEREA